MSHGLRKKPSYFPLYWLVNSDPYNGLLKSPYTWVVFHPLYNRNNQGPFFHCSLLIFIPRSQAPTKLHHVQPFVVSPPTSRKLGLAAQEIWAMATPNLEDHPS